MIFTRLFLRRPRFDYAKYPSIPKEIGQDYFALDGRQYGQTVSSLLMGPERLHLNQGQLDFISSHVFGEKFLWNLSTFTKFFLLVIDSTNQHPRKSTYGLHVDQRKALQQNIV